MHLSFTDGKKSKKLVKLVRHFQDTFHQFIQKYSHDHLNVFGHLRYNAYRFLV